MPCQAVLAFAIRWNNGGKEASKHFQMCGIVGILARKTQIPPAVLERATRSLEHRGPDDSGIVLLKEARPEPLEVGLGRWRLAPRRRFARGNQKEQSPLISKHADEKSRMQAPDDPVHQSLKARRGFVQ
jgi:hypothetical protein